MFVSIPYQNYGHLRYKRNISANVSESELLEKYRTTGNIELLGALYEPYMALVYGLCYKYLQDEAKSQDTVMQIFEELISKLRVHEVSNFKSWLYTLAKNNCLMQLRNESKNHTLPMEEVAISEVEAMQRSSINEHDSKEERLSLMESCLSELKDDQQLCVRLFYLEQKCYKEIAEITGFDLLKVKSHIQNGKRNLKICMERKGND